MKLKVVTTVTLFKAKHNKMTQIARIGFFGVKFTTRSTVISSLNMKQTRMRQIQKMPPIIFGRTESHVRSTRCSFGEGFFIYAFAASDNAHKKRGGCLTRCQTASCNSLLPPFTVFVPGMASASRECHASNL